MKKGKLKLASVAAASAVLMTGCMSIADKAYIGHLKNKARYGRAAEQFDNVIQSGNMEWLDEFLAEYPDFDVNYCGEIAREYGQAGAYRYETFDIVTNSGKYYNEELLNRLFEKGLDPNLSIRMAKGGNMIVFASSGDKKLFDVLLEKGADVNCITGADSPLCYASRNSLEKTKRLIEKGAKLDEGLFKHFDIIGADPYAKQYLIKHYIENVGEPPVSNILKYAVLGESELLMEELRKKPELSSSEDKSVLSYILHFCEPEVLKLYAENYQASGTRIAGEFRKLALMGKDEMIKYCIDNGYVDASTDYYHSYGTTLLHYYFIENNAEMYSYILEKGFYEKKNAGLDLLDAAFESRDINEFKRLIDFAYETHGFTEFNFHFLSCNIEWSNFTKSAMDYLRERYGLRMQCINLCCLDVKTAEYLYNNGKTIFPQDLPKAVKKNDTEMVRLVLEQGADPNQKGYELYFTQSSLFETAFEYDVDYERFIAEREKDKNVTLSKCIKSAVYCGSDMVQAFIDYGADLSDDEIMVTAIYAGSFRTFKLLYEAGASLNYCHSIGQETLLDFARRTGRKNIAEILEKEGVKSARMLKEDKNALDYVLEALDY